VEAVKPVLQRLMVAAIGNVDFGYLLPMDDVR
jgi:hypothetical protein